MEMDDAEAKRLANELGGKYYAEATKEWGEQMIRATAEYTAALIEALKKVDLDR